MFLRSLSTETVGFYHRLSTTVLGTTIHQSKAFFYSIIGAFFLVHFIFSQFKKHKLSNKTIIQIRTNYFISIMKFSIAVLSFAIASVQGSSLRPVADSNSNSNSKNNGNVLDSEVILKGTVGEPTAEDMEFIGKALVASYNNVHWEVGHYMTGSHAVDFKGPDSFLCRHCPDDDSMGGAASSSTSVFEVKTPVGFLCRHCPDDDAMGADSLLMTAVTKDCAGLCKKDAAAELEVNFCNKIRSAQGSEYLGSAKSCAIRFDVDDETKKTNNKQRVSSATNKVATIDSTIILKGAGAGDPTKEEQAILAKAFVSAYNDVHWGANHYLTDAEIPFTAATGSPDGFLCRHCPDDDSMGGQETTAMQTNTLVLDIVSPIEAFLCRHCPDDDAMGGTSQFNLLESLGSSAFDKKAVEVAFCNKIQNSVSNKLAATKSCSIAVESVIAVASSAKTHICQRFTPRLFFLFDSLAYRTVRYEFIVDLPFRFVSFRSIAVLKNSYRTNPNSILRTYRTVQIDTSEQIRSYHIVYLFVYVCIRPISLPTTRIRTRSTGQSLPFFRHRQDCADFLRLFSRSEQCTRKGYLPFRVRQHNHCLENGAK